MLIAINYGNNFCDIATNIFEMWGFATWIWSLPYAKWLPQRSHFGSDGVNLTCILASGVNALLPYSKH